MSTMYVITPGPLAMTEEFCYQLSTAPECNTLPSYLCDQTGLRFVHGGIYHDAFDWSAYGGHDAGKITLVPKFMASHMAYKYPDALIESKLSLSGANTIFVERPTDATIARAWKHREASMFERMVFTGSLYEKIIDAEIAYFNRDAVAYESGDTHPDDSTDYRAALKSAGLSGFELDFAIYAGSGKANWPPADGVTNDATTLAEEAALDVSQIHDSDYNTVFNSKLSSGLHIPMKDLNDNRGAVITSLAGKGITATESMFEMFNGMLDGTDDSSTAITDDSIKALLQTKVNHTGTFNYVAP